MNSKAARAHHRASYQKILAAGLWARSSNPILEEGINSHWLECQSESIYEMECYGLSVKTRSHKRVVH